MQYNSKHFLTFHVLYFSRQNQHEIIPPFMSEILAHPCFFIGLASIFYKSSSILKSKNIVHPWLHEKIFLHVIGFSIPCVKKDFINVNKIFQKRFAWVHLLMFTCSCSQAQKDKVLV